MTYILGSANGSGQKEYGRKLASGKARCRNCIHWNPSSKRLGLCSDRLVKGYNDVWSRSNGTCLKFNARKKG